MTPYVDPQVSHGISPQKGNTLCELVIHVEHTHFVCGYASYKSGQSSQSMLLQKDPSKGQNAPQDFIVFADLLWLFSKESISSSVSLLKKFLFFFKFFFIIIQYIGGSVARGLHRVQQHYKTHEPHGLSHEESSEDSSNNDPHPETFLSTAFANLTSLVGCVFAVFVVFVFFGFEVPLFAMLSSYDSVAIPSVGHNTYDVN